jgi:predicted RNA binding protein YcfA (HicA-like mRNA interferase family)
MPRKIRELKADLRRAGFEAVPRRGKGSHAIWKHAASGAQVNLAGADGTDAQYYQEREVRAAIIQSRRRLEEDQDVADR